MAVWHGRFIGQEDTCPAIAIFFSLHIVLLLRCMAEAETFNVPDRMESMASAP